MNIKFSLHIIGNILKFLGLLMLVPAVFPLIYHEDDLWPLLISALITSGFGFILERITKPSETIHEIGRKDGFIVATLSWLGASAFGALPFIIYGALTNPADAFFESASGFTTTGASVITDVEALPRGILFWRSFTQWLGGMGIIVLGIAILPRLAVGGMQLMGLEASGPTTEKITPRIAETAKKLWGVYSAISVVLVLCLLFAGMPLYDSILHTFSTVSTGGYSLKNASIGAYHSPVIEVIVTVFMFICATNFVLLYWLMRGDVKRLLRNSEFKFYFFLNLIAVLLVALQTRSAIFPSFLEALRYSSFNVISISTTTGFATANFDLWPPFSKWLLLILMFFGACAGSTSGAIKNIRIVVLLKRCYQEIHRLIYPRAVLPVRVDRKPVSQEVLSSITGFFLLYLLIFLVASLLVMAEENLPIITAISACATTMGNVGPGFGEIGPAGNYSNLSDFTKVILSILMLIGRLELFTVLVLFTPVFWRK